jgi:excisionase family DNA binding protein
MMNVFADSSTLSLSQAAQRLGVSLGTIRCWSDLGYLASHRTQAGQLRFRSEDIDAFAGTEQPRQIGTLGARQAG